MSNLTALLQQKISHSDYRDMIIRHSKDFSSGEIRLLEEILQRFGFDVVQEQALAQTVLQQARFDPDAFHIDSDDEDVTGVCPHCINPPMPPLRDYLQWREQRS
ncbi:hypothetical protein [Neisseria animalis]|uniref:Uncharacterized protein n=1 Tax=Neisseria animalis TaxID=492 RepID=A0A5P3MT14_NEIAN|nr:hypothetical protein [Neisseria animalis]QEY24752.1 hypothetical protein D0T90_09990 [Neisseria animalis]ROW31848.1 hypothetical protein CGZ60_08180 [Neisseria animalis]VEE07789.1 Uncharacterised protein [Neisseria animalis]